tara:strand:+ start:56 stop:421 length:366 start_codon:yes stop_codon:yes gene_type:complete
MKKYNTLYLDILKIGSIKLSDGLSYDVLKKELEKKGYDFENDCIELAVKQWFYDSFHHYADDNELTNVYDLENHLHCNFILKGASALKLIEFKTSRNRLRVAMCSLFIALIAIGFSIYLNI